jgi:hypothetical protein
MRQGFRRQTGPVLLETVSRKYQSRLTHKSRRINLENHRFTGTPRSSTETATCPKADSSNFCQLPDCRSPSRERHRCRRNKVLTLA